MTFNAATIPLRRHSLSALAAWARAPRATGMVVPSGKVLVQRLADQVDPNDDGWVIELGAGTGVVTKALLERGISPSKLMVVEYNDRMFKILKSHFSGVTLVHGDAAQLQNYMKAHGVTKVQAVISSLPLLSLPDEVEENILTAVSAAIGDCGKLVQYSYGLFSPVPVALMRRFGWQARVSAKVFQNIPPAKVWVYQR